jgi:hypothetical protein
VPSGSARVHRSHAWESSTIPPPTPVPPGGSTARDNRAVKFILEVDLDTWPDDGEAGRELGRILRYWGGAAPNLDLRPGQGFALYDSANREVGRWTVTDAPDASS